MAARRPLPPTAPLADRARLFHALSDETRLAILRLLRQGERCVCDLQEDLKAAQSRLSFHLKVLRDAGLVRDRKEGRWSFYTLNADRVADVESYAADLRTSLAVTGGSGGTAGLHRLGKARGRVDDPCCGERLRESGAGGE